MTGRQGRCRAGTGRADNEDYDNVNGAYSEDLEEHLKEVEYYIGNSMEALLLFKEFLKSEVEE